MEKTSKSKVSPYRLFSNWLFDGSKTSQVPEECIKVVNKRSVLSMFGNFNDITIYLNNLFNKFDLMKLDDMEFYNFIKFDIVEPHHLNRWKMSFYKTNKKDKELSEIRKKLPLLKINEIDYLLKVSKQDENYSSFSESIGIRSTSKAKKLTKAEKKRIEKEFEDKNEEDHQQDILYEESANEDKDKDIKDSVKEEKTQDDSIFSFKSILSMYGLSEKRIEGNVSFQEVG